MTDKTSSSNKNRFFPLLCALLSGLVIIGWLFNFDVLTRPLAGQIPMNPVTAVFLLLTSVSLYLILKRYESKRIDALVSFISFTILALASLKLGSDILGGDSKIDTTLFRDKLTQDSAIGMNYLMAPSTAFSFILASLAILLSKVKLGKNQYPSQYIAVLIVSIGLFSVIGYIYQLAPFYDSLAFRPMSTLSAFCFILVSLSIFFIHRDKGFVGEFTSTLLGGIIARRFIPATVIAQITIGLVFLFIYKKYDLPLELIVGILITANIVLGIQFVWYNAQVINQKHGLLLASENQTKEISNRLKVTTKASGVGLWEVNILKNKLTWDEQIYELFGITPDTYSNAFVALKKGVHPEDYEFIMAELDKAIREKTDYSCEFRVIWPDKSIHYIKSIGTLKTQSDGKPSHFLGTNWDITPSKEAEKALQEYKYFFTDNNDLAAIANTEGYFDNVNKKFKTVLGYTFEELTQNAFESFIHPDDLQSTYDEYNEQLKGKETIQFTNRYIKKNGEYVYLEWNAKTNQQTGKLYAIARDITEQRKISDKIEQDNIFLETILENIPDMIFVKDAKELKYISFNRAGEEIFGFQRSNLINKDDFEIFPKEIANSFIKQDKLVLQNGEVLNIEEEKVILNKDSSTTDRWFHTKKIPVTDAKGAPLYLIGISHEITEKKHKDELLAKQAKRLTEVNEELETFSYSVSHDLRAPLRSLQGFSNALLTKYEGKLDEDGERWLQFIGSNSKRMGILINDMLDFSKLTRLDVVKSNIEMKAIALDIFEAEKSNYTDKVIHLELGELPDANGDTAMIRQVWHNLISNALKYSIKKEVINIKINGETQNGFHTYTVKDEGVGFDEKYKDKLFTVFQRLHSDDEFEGTGVGLAIVYRIIKKHAGTIEATSEVGFGSEFKFNLPI